LLGLLGDRRSAAAEMVDGGTIDVIPAKAGRATL